LARPRANVRNRLAACIGRAAARGDARKSEAVTVQPGGGFLLRLEAGVREGGFSTGIGPQRDILRHRCYQRDWAAGSLADLFSTNNCLAVNITAAKQVRLKADLIDPVSAVHRAPTAECESAPKWDPGLIEDQPVDLVRELGRQPGSRSAPIRTPPRTNFLVRHQRVGVI
jgi:hypothetical protein